MSNEKPQRTSRGPLLATILGGFLAGFALVMMIADADAAPRADVQRMAAKSAYRQFVDDFWPRARRAGISRTTYRRAFADMTPDWEVLRRQRRQPEFKLSADEYIATRVSPRRIAKGVEMLRTHGALLCRLERRYGVDRHVLLAIWGMESNYGGHMGTHQVIRALATLSIAGHRRRYGRQQLLAALKILQAGDISPAQMKGSWAGAMGHTQFIPTTYLGYAVDFDGDKRRDIWNSVADALASTANYLKKRGWRRGRPWGWEVKVPARAARLVGRRHARSVRAWQRLGVRPVNARAFYALDARAWLVRPRGSSHHYLVTGNFRALLAYNNARVYAIAVGKLADAMAGAARKSPVTAASSRSAPAPRDRQRLRALAEAAARATATVD